MCFNIPKRAVSFRPNAYLTCHTIKARSVANAFFSSYRPVHNMFRQGAFRALKSHHNSKKLWLRLMEAAFYIFFGNITYIKGRSRVWLRGRSGIFLADFCQLHTMESCKRSEPLLAGVQGPP